MENVFDIQAKLRSIAKLVTQYQPEDMPRLLNGFDVEMTGYAHSTLTLAVNKQTDPVDFAAEQAEYMEFLGVCPRIFAITDDGYVMEYLRPIYNFTTSLRGIEAILNHVWSLPLSESPFAKQIGDEYWRQELEDTIGIKVPDWALGEPCIIHGDPTMDNAYVTKLGAIRLADPIPPHRLKRPSIRAVDYGKMLQSLLGWEVVLRNEPFVVYSWPEFMLHPHSAMQAVFWAMVALKRIALRNNKRNAGKWAEHISEELKQCMSSF